MATLLCFPNMFSAACTASFDCTSTTETLLLFHVNRDSQKLKMVTIIVKAAE